MQEVSAWWPQIHQEGTVWLLLGKGPTFHQYAQYNLAEFRVIAINHVIREIAVDVASIVDIDVVTACSEVLDRNARFLLMPSYPYDSNGRQSSPLESYFDAIPVLRKLDVEGRLIRYHLGSELCKTGEVCVPTGTFSAEVLVNLLAELGARKIRTLGIDGGRRYDPTFKDIEAFTCLSNGQATFDVQFEGITLAIRRFHLDYAALYPPPANLERTLRRAYIRGVIRRIFPMWLRERTRPCRKRALQMFHRRQPHNNSFSLRLPTRPG